MIYHGLSYLSKILVLKPQVLYLEIPSFKVNVTQKLDASMLSDTSTLGAVADAQCFRVEESNPYFIGKEFKTSEG